MILRSCFLVPRGRRFVFASGLLLMICSRLSAAEPAKPKLEVRGTGAANDPTRQTDADWMDGRWSKTDVGQFLGATIETPGRRTPKGIAIKIGEHHEASVCFDTDLLRMSAGWTGGFLQLHPRRYGLIQAPTIDGAVQFQSAPRPGWAKDGKFDDPRATKFGSLPRDHAHYRGLYRHGQRVVLAYTVGETAVLESPWIESATELLALTRTFDVSAGPSPLRVLLASENGAEGRVQEIGGVRIATLPGAGRVTAIALVGKNVSLAVEGRQHVIAEVPGRTGPQQFKALIWSGAEEALPQFAALARASARPAALAGWTRGGAPNWTETLTTRGMVGQERGPFQIDTLPLPESNPWNALFFTSGHDFFDNGDLAVSTAHGDVWVVRGVDATLEKLTWRRFATGLHQPLGLKIVNNRVHVLERDQITILHDLNSDGEADFYENFNNDCISAGGGHSYATCLETDPQGNFYFIKCSEDTPHGGTLLKVARDGQTLEVLATGFRNPNGLGVSPAGLVTAADQQGTWIPETRLDAIRPGGFYGYMPMHKREQKPEIYDGPLCWIPRELDNSAGGQTWVPKGNWGPLSEQMIHLSYGRCTMMMVLTDEVNGGAQGGAVSLPGRFLSGVMRGRFNPRDGHLYLTGLRGWQTAAVRDGCLQRVRYTGAPVYLPIAFAVHTNGIRLTFSQPLDRTEAGDAENYGIEQWNYRWSEKYGSPDFSLANPEEIGRDAVPVRAAKLLADGRSVFLETSPLQPVMQMGIRYNLEAADGELIRGVFYLTIHRLSSAMTAE